MSNDTCRLEELEKEDGEVEVVKKRVPIQDGFIKRSTTEGSNYSQRIDEEKNK